MDKWRDELRAAILDHTTARGIFTGQTLCAVREIQGPALAESFVRHEVKRGSEIPTFSYFGRWPGTTNQQQHRGPVIL